MGLDGFCVGAAFWELMGEWRVCTTGVGGGPSVKLTELNEMWDIAPGCGTFGGILREAEVGD